MFGNKQSVSLVDQYKKKQINLLPDLYFKKKRRVRFVILIALLVAIGISGFAYQIVELNRALKQVKVENTQVLQAIQEKQEERNRQTLLTALKQRIEFKVNLLKDIEDENASVIRVSEAIESALPSGVLYVNVDFVSTDSMTIFGRTETDSEIPDLIHKLRTLNLFNEVKVDTISRSEYANYTGTDIFYDFTLVCRFGGDKDEIDE